MFGSRIFFPFCLYGIPSYHMWRIVKRRHNVVLPFAPFIIPAATTKPQFRLLYSFSSITSHHYPHPLTSLAELDLSYYPPFFFSRPLVMCVSVVYLKEEKKNKVLWKIISPSFFFIKFPSSQVRTSGDINTKHMFSNFWFCPSYFGQWLQ